MTTTTWVSSSVHVADDTAPTVTVTEPSQDRPAGLAHLHIGPDARLIFGSPHAAAAVADACQEAQRRLRRAQLARVFAPYARVPSAPVVTQLPAKVRS